MVRRESAEWDLGNNPLHIEYPEEGALFNIVNEAPSFPLTSTFTPFSFVYFDRFRLKNPRKFRL